MKKLFETMLQMEEIHELSTAIETKDVPAIVTGLSPVHRAIVCATLQSSLDRPILVICNDEAEMRRQASDLHILTGAEPLMLFCREWQFRPSASVSREWTHLRLSSLSCLAQSTPSVIVSTADALMQRCIPRDVLTKNITSLEVGQSYDLPSLINQLTSAGYVRCEQLEGPGQFALRGGILDIYSPSMKDPVRCEFFDDELDSMGYFKVDTQRRTENISRATILPAREVLVSAAKKTPEDLAALLEAAVRKYGKKEHTEALCHQLTSDADALRNGRDIPGVDRYLSLIYEDFCTPFDYLPKNTVVCLCECSRTMENMKDTQQLLKDDIAAAYSNGWLYAQAQDYLLSESEFTKRLSSYPYYQLDSLPGSRYFLRPQKLFQISAKQLATYGGSLDIACTDITHYLQIGYRIMVLCGGEVRCQNMSRILFDRGIKSSIDYHCASMPEIGHVGISIGAISSGAEFPSIKLAILTEGQLLESVSRREQKVRKSRDSSRQKIQAYTDLSPGDFVVHTHHGIGRFVGIVSMPVDGINKDYIKIAYAGTDCLYVPCTSLDLISKYIGSGGDDSERTPRLNKLGGTDWAKATHKAKAAAKDLAEGLIKLYAERQRLKGFAFSPDSPWQREFEDAFEYAETDDQLRAIADIKDDMERNTPMDRLLCGDVGYGKTEVALRAVMKCILDGKQAAILVPTTVLAQQHYATASSRFRSFPVNIDVLSRFRTAGQVKNILERTKSGQIDLLIGTHKLLSKNVEFKDLGLLIIDEEQRFGVSHKEKLRERAKQVDTLTLSATPIPRTLNMALSGIRDMSTIEQPPQDRRPVQTYVIEHDWATILDAIHREIARGGQVYYLHNKVDSIDSTAAKLHQLLNEEVTIGVAHGKMGEIELSRTMQRMSDGEIQVLVCTTIIETGIDIPNVNTLIIEEADHLGLSQLHQIRGRIGRSSRRAYAYLTYRTGKVLTEIATKRLNAIREYVEFGSGFKIAMRDMEIRGAGNLLGSEQSGYMMSVGYDMYLKLLNDAILEQQGKSSAIELECSADLTVSANIPERYIRSAEQRMDLYRRIAAIRCAEDSDDILDEMTDRYGDPPKSVMALLEIALLRTRASKLCICDISQKGSSIVFTFTEDLDVFAVTSVCSMSGYRNRLRLNAGKVPTLTLFLQPRENALSAAGKLIEDLTLKFQEHTV